MLNFQFLNVFLSTSNKVFLLIRYLNTNNRYYYSTIVTVSDIQAVNYLFYANNNNRNGENWKLDIVHQYLIQNRQLAKLIGGD